jgi:hypothetical protein
MQCYVVLMMVSATLSIAWVALELLGRPILALVRLRREALEQILALGGMALPKPRETATSSRGIREYDQAMTNLAQAQYILRDLGSRLLAFGESEPTILVAMGLFGLNIIVAGQGLMALSEVESWLRIDRARVLNDINSALRAKSGAQATALQPDRHSLINFQAKSMCLREVGVSM